MSIANRTLLKTIFVFLLGTLIIANMRPASAREIHPDPRVTCLICRMRVASILWEDYQKSTSYTSAGSCQSWISRAARKAGRSIKKRRIPKRSRKPNSGPLFRTLGSRENKTLGSRENKTLGSRENRTLGSRENVPKSEKNKRDTRRISKLVRPDFTAENRAFITKLNQENSGTFLAVELTSASPSVGKPQYKVYTGEGKPIEARDVRTLVTKINGQMKSSGYRTFYFIPMGLSRQKRDAFISTARIQMGQVMPHVSTRFLEVDGEGRLSSNPFFLFFSPNAQIRDGSFTKPTKVTKGRFKDFHGFSVKVMEASRNAVLIIYAKTKEILESFRKFLEGKTSNNLSKLPPAEIIKRARAEFIKKHGLSSRDIKILYRDEFGLTEVVRVLKISDSLLPTE